MMAISVVLFDLGNVLTHIDLDAAWCSLGLNEPSERLPFFEGYESLTRQYETGLISTATFLQNLQSLFGNRFTLNQLQLAFESVITTPIEGMSEIVKELSGVKQTALVSNTNDLHYVLSYARLESLRMLHKQYLSYRLKVMKPDHGFYQSIINDMQLPPSQMLFIDDLETNVEGACLAGMHALRFDGVENLKHKLIHLGIL
jgi:HAD superfamily hydrolase (TIGR01509 family)